MRVMVMIKADRNSEAGKMPGEQLLAAMGRFNEALVQAGVMQAGEGLHPSSKGARVRLSGSQRSVVDGPFAETGELIAGFWIWQVASMQEAIDWVKRCPNPMEGDSEVEIRPVFEAADFGTEFTPELREQEDRLRRQIASQAKAVPAVPVPRGALPYLVIRGAADAIAFYQRAFGAEQVLRLDMPNGQVLHAEMRVGPASFLLTEEHKERGALSPLSLGGSSTTAVLYVPDVDATVASALAAGAKLAMPVDDQFWGDRSGSLTDPFGHSWFISTHKEEPSEDELKQRLRAMFQQRGATCG